MVGGDSPPSVPLHSPFDLDGRVWTGHRPWYGEEPWAGFGTEKSDRESWVLHLKGA